MQVFEDPVGTGYIPSFYFSVPPFFCQWWSNQINQHYRFICGKMDIWILSVPSYDYKAYPLDPVIWPIWNWPYHWAKWVVGWLCTVLIFRIRSCYVETFLKYVWFQLVYPFELLLMLFFHHLQFSVNSALLKTLWSLTFL